MCHDFIVEFVFVFNIGEWTDENGELADKDRERDPLEIMFFVRCANDEIVPGWIQKSRERVVQPRSRRVLFENSEVSELYLAYNMKYVTRISHPDHFAYSLPSQ